MTDHTGLPDEPSDSGDRAEATAALLTAGFTIDTDDAGWIAEYAAGYHRVRVESIPGGWLVSHVRVVGSFERVKAEHLLGAFLLAAQLAVETADALNLRLRLVGSVAGPLLAELRRTS